MAKKYQTASQTSRAPTDSERTVAWERKKRKLIVSTRWTAPLKSFSWRLSCFFFFFSLFNILHSQRPALQARGGGGRKRREVNAVLMREVLKWRSVLKQNSSAETHHSPATLGRFIETSGKNQSSSPSNAWWRKKGRNTGRVYPANRMPGYIKSCILARCLLIRQENWLQSRTDVFASGNESAVHSCVHNVPTCAESCFLFCRPTVRTGWVWSQQQHKHVAGKQPTAVPTSGNAAAATWPGHVHLLPR